MTKVGLIGHGHWGKILAVKLSHHFELAFIADSQTPYDNKLDAVEWVFVATPVASHYQIVKTCLNSGCHVFCEKPLTLNPEQSNELFELADSQGLKFYVDNIFLDRDEIRQLNIAPKNIIRLDFFWSKSDIDKAHFIDGLLYHDIYLMYFLLGRPNHQVKTRQFSQTDSEFLLEIAYGNVNVSFHYTRAAQKQKRLVINHSDSVDLSKPQNDPLEEILVKIANKAPLDYVFNRDITLTAEHIIKHLGILANE